MSAAFAEVIMKRCHFALITHCANSNTYPALPLCAELVNRGHRVTYVTNNHYARIIAKTGAEAVVFKERPIPRRVEEEMRRLDSPDRDHTWSAAMRVVRVFSFAQAVEILSQIDDFYQTNAPDVILYDRYHVAGRILASRLGIPAVQISPSFAYYKDLAVRENGVCRNSEEVLEWAEELDLFLLTQGVTTSRNYWHIENLNIHFIPKEFQYHSDYFDDRFCFAGALLDRPFQRVWTDRSDGKPLILISGVSSLHARKLDLTEYFRMFVDALSDSRCHCVLSVAGETYLGSLPANFEINQHASHLEILPHTDLAISHGGLATTLEAIYNGVPTFMIPQNVACGEVAYRVEELGLGTQISRKELSVKNIRNTVELMLTDSSLVRRVREMQQKFRQSGGAKLAADRLEDCLRG